MSTGARDPLIHNPERLRTRQSIIKVWIAERLAHDSTAA